MKGFRTLLIGIVVLTVQYTLGQSFEGITGVPDTSYTTQSAYTNTLRSHPETKMVDAILFADSQIQMDVVYGSTPDRNLLLDVFLPKKESANGVGILIVHGGGWRTGNRTQHYPLAKKLAQLGYTCFTPEYRLSTEALFPAAVYDIKAAIRWVRQNADRYQIDHDKIVALGFSAGGELAAFMGTTGNMPLFEGQTVDPNLPSNVNAVVDIDGTLSFVHPESGEGDDSQRTSAATYWFGYAKDEHPLLWQVASPLDHAGENTPPFLFLNSSVDRMHAGRDDLIRILDRFGTYSQVHTFEGAPHSFCLFEPWFTPTVSLIDGFLTKVFRLK